MLFLVRTTPRGHGGQGGRPGLQRPGEEEDEEDTAAGHHHHLPQHL